MAPRRLLKLELMDQQRGALVKMLGRPPLGLQKLGTTMTDALVGENGPWQASHRWDHQEQFHIWLWRPRSGSTSTVLSGKMAALST